MGWEPKSRPRSSNWSSMALKRTTTSVAAILIACLAATSCTGGSSNEAQTSSATRPSSSQPTAETFTIKHSGTHVYSRIAPGDQVKCIAGGGGGIVPPAR